MTDINKLIEEYTIDDFERMAMETDYAIEASEDTCKINEADAGAFYKEGFVSGIKLILHQNRWRNVEEELPEMGQLIAVKYKMAEYYDDKYTIYEIDSSRMLDILKEYGSKWKPIL